jgi:fumarate reductase subunit C
VSALPSSSRLELRLWLAQRLSAALLAVCVAVHLVTIVWAVRGGLTAADILARTKGNTAWLAFYAVFVAAVAVHAPIGLRTIAAETLGRRGRALDIAALAFAAFILAAGLRAAYGLYR